MKRTLYRNIDLVRIPIKAGISEYYFPQNVDWAACKVDRIAACIPDAPCVDPMDGTTPVLDGANYQDLFFNIYSSDQREILHAVSAEQLLHVNNNPIYLDSKLDLSLCSCYFTTAPAQDCTLLLYVYHDNAEGELNDLPERSITVEFPLNAYQQINFQQIIETYIHALPATVKGVMFWNAKSDPAYFTLRNYKQTYVLQNLHSELARPNMNGGTAIDTQLAPMYFDAIDIDFQYSHIRECGGISSTQKITILY